MTVYQSSGLTTQVTITGTDDIAINASDSVNSITGSTGVVNLKFALDGATLATIVSFCPLSQTWEYANVPYTTLSEGTGAEFTVTTSYGNVYGLTLTNGGTDYTDGDTFTVSGTDLGGTSPTNDLVISALQVTAGVITKAVIDSGTSVWPVSLTQSTSILPGASDFVQVNSGNLPDGVFVRAEGTDGTLLITPVTIVG